MLGPDLRNHIEEKELRIWHGGFNSSDLLVYDGFNEV